MFGMWEVPVGVKLLTGYFVAYTMMCLLAALYTNCLSGWKCLLLALAVLASPFSCVVASIPWHLKYWPHPFSSCGRKSMCATCSQLWIYGRNGGSQEHGGVMKENFFLCWAFDTRVKKKGKCFTQACYAGQCTQITLLSRRPSLRKSCWKPLRMPYWDRHQVCGWTWYWNSITSPTIEKKSTHLAI